MFRYVTTIWFQIFTSSPFMIIFPCHSTLYKLCSWSSLINNLRNNILACGCFVCCDGRTLPALSLNGNFLENN
jgi:hypothetical protein